jgi:hypothetical protein
VAAASCVLDPSGANLQLNTQPSGAAGYHIRDGDDWGARAIQDFINASGVARLEDIDGLIAAARLTRTITLPMRVKGSNIDDLNLKLSTLNFSLDQASRYKPIDLVFTPSGSTKTSTYRIYGGSIDDPYTNQRENNSLAFITLTLIADPWVRGAKQTLGSTGSPLFAAAAGPGAFTVTPTAGSEGDVLADVTIIFQLTADTAGAVTIADISGNTGWAVSSDITSWTNGSGGGTRAAQSNAKYKGGAAPGYIVSAVSVIEQAYTKTFSTTDFPVQTPIRVLLTADDFQVLSARRGLYQIRLAVSAGGVTAYGDWVSVPASAGNGTTTHFLQALDMGTFVFPPGPAGSVAFSGTTTIAIEVQDNNLNANKLTTAFDQLIFLPDASSVIAEWPVTQPAANTAIRLETDMLYNQADGAPQSVLMTGAHVRCRGATRYGIWASDQPLANSAGDVTNSLVKAWAEYVPRYVGHAPA